MGKKDTVTKSKKTATNDSKKVNNATKEKLNANIKLEEAKTELRKLVAILVCMIILICIFYVIASVVTKNNSKLKYVSNEEVSQISYTDILASDILNKNGAYYVLVKESDNQYVGLFETYVSSYKTKTDSLPVYFVDLDNALNKKYIAEQSNFASDALKFKGTTFLKINDHKVEFAYETNDEINAHMKELFK